ncbi:MAG: acyl-phosphate glycerol 3-phosphate acyltransferase [Treponema sp. CETP13]|nr:MAG: acyl-phosphate glycerol 3-phosphate acyltransferase [Treponema sp. CETP13]
MAYVHLALIVLISYLVGSFPTSIVVGKVFYKKDIRNYGSGNAGGTNAVRVFGLPTGIAVILVDILKGILPVLCIANIPNLSRMQQPLLSQELTAIIAGSSAVIGHIWTVFASFRGGKGVATAAGMLMVLYPIGFLLTLPAFVIAVAISGIVSVGSLTVAFVFPAILWTLTFTEILQTAPSLLYFSILIGLLIIFTHRKNIIRLIHGEEKPLFKKTIKNLFSFIVVLAGSPL